MATVKVLGGSFERANGIWYKQQFGLWAPGTRPSRIGVSSPTVRIKATSLRTIEVATEESVTRVGGAAAWGAVGLVALGPLGAAAGAILGGHGKDVTFVAEFSDGRKLLATVDARTYKEILAAKSL